MLDVAGCRFGYLPEEGSELAVERTTRRQRASVRSSSSCSRSGDSKWLQRIKMAAKLHNSSQFSFFSLTICSSTRFRKIPSNRNMAPFAVCCTVFVSLPMPFATTHPLQRAWGAPPRPPLGAATTYPNWIQFGLGIGLFHYSTEIYKILPTCRASAVGSSIGRLSSCRPFRSWFRIT